MNSGACFQMNSGDLYTRAQNRSRVSRRGAVKGVEEYVSLSQTQSAVLTAHDWVVYKLGALLGSVGHKVKIHKITAASDKEPGDIERNDYIVLPREQDNCLPPRSLILDFTMTHDRFGRSPYWTVHAHKAM
jgi:hypothetical protein